MNKLQNSINQGFSYYFFLMMEGSGAGSILVTEGFGRPKKRTDPDSRHWLPVLVSCLVDCNSCTKLKVCLFQLLNRHCFVRGDACTYKHRLWHFFILCFRRSIKLL
jgi:hypothetical protein